MDLNEQKSISIGKLIVSLILVFSVGVAVGFVGSTQLDSTDTSPEMETEGDFTDSVEDDPLEAQAGVTFDDQGDSLVVQLVSVQQADKVYVANERGEEKTLYDPESGDGGVGTTVTFQNLNEGDNIAVVGVLDGQENIIQSYTM